jgi:electron transfer flavoprotein alpha subunit
LNANNEIWVFSEKYNLQLEILGKGRELADKLGTNLSAVLIGNNLKERSNELINLGADKVFLVENPSLEHFELESYLSILHDLVAENKPDTLLIGSTKNGKSLAARLSFRFETGCIPDCSQLSIDEKGRLICQRIAYGGSAVVKLSFKTKPQIATIPPRIFKKPESQNRNGQIIEVKAKIEEPQLEVVETKPLEVSSVRIEEADVVLSCGRGFSKKEDVSLLEDLAKVLGAQVGCSRPLAEDRKWFTEWVGLSGHKVKPKLYFAVGVSGIIQHVAGIRDSGIIVAINNDSEAPIFEHADYGVVANLYDILPALTEAFKKQLK